MKNKKVLILANSGIVSYRFRKELFEDLLKRDYEVAVSQPPDRFVPLLEEMGCSVFETEIDSRGTNPLKDLSLLFQYTKMMKESQPDIVLTYTIKPNVYGGLAARMLRIPYISNVTGLGTAVANGGWLSRITLFLYKMGLEEAKRVFFQNRENLDFFRSNEVVTKNATLVPGSGVNVDEYSYLEYPKESEPTRFLFIGRIMKDKRIEEFLYAAKRITQEYPRVEFDVIGAYVGEYRERLSDLVLQKVIRYHGEVEDVRPHLKRAHAVVLPSYHEGLSNVLLEGAASGRPILASTVSGCKETFDEGETGFGFVAKDAENLVFAMQKFLFLNYEKKREMGLNGRKKIVRCFDRKQVVKAYMAEIEGVPSLRAGSRRAVQSGEAQALIEL